MAEEMDTPGRGPDPGPHHRRRQPGAVHAELGPARRRHRRPRVRGRGRHLRQRDHPPRRRDPAGAVRPAEGPLRRRAPAARARTTSPTTASPCSRSTPTSPTSGRCWPAWPSCSRAPAPPPIPAIVDDLMITSMVQGSVADETSPIYGRDRRRDPRRARRLGAGPSASSTSCCAPARTARASVPTRRALPRRACSPTRTASTSVPSSPACPTCCAPRRDDRAGARSSSLADVARLHEGARRPARPPVRAGRPPRPALEQLVDAQRRRCS